MAKIVSECPKCRSKGVIEKSHSTIGNIRIITLSCGHIYSEKLSLSKVDEIVLEDNRKLRPYQIEGVKFAERSGFNCLIGDEQGLGKTVQALALLKLHWQDLKPVLVICKGSLTIQWQRQILTGTGKFAQIIDRLNKPIPRIGIWIVSFDMTHKLKHEIEKLKIKTIIADEIQAIKNHEAKRTNGVRDIVNARLPDEEIPNKIPESRIKTIAYDLLTYHGLDKRFEILTKNLGSSVLGKCLYRVEGEGIIVGQILLSTHHVKFHSEDEIIETILHEIAHAITPGAGHSKIWRDTCKSIEGNGEAYAWCEGAIKIGTEGERSVKGKIFLSGTPIKNNALEYFPALNLLRPEIFPHRQYYINQWVDFYYKDVESRVAKAAGLKYPEEFKTLTKDFIIRRTRKEVLPELPEINRDYQYYEMEEEIQKAYNVGVRKLDTFLKENDPGSKTFNSQLHGHMMILYHITGLAKINPILSYIEEFIENSSNGNKLALFHHHVDVGDVFEKKFNDLGIPSVRIVSSYDAFKRTQILDRFRNDPEVKFFLGPTLACGEGIDLEFCDKAILCEREWNPANEEQVEGRFIRATEEFVEKRKADGKRHFDVIYPVAVGSIDEFFAELVERKRQYVTETLSGQRVQAWSESDVMLELARRAVSKINKGAK